MGEKFVYSFEEGSREMKELLGGKGANLSEMSSLGLPVPPGFTITTKACDLFNKNNNTLPEEIKQEVDSALRGLENKMGKKLGDNHDPLLVSVRSGAAISMPGMMDTVLNLGLNDETVKGLAEKTNNQRFAYDAYRRFIQMFGDVVIGIKNEKFENKIEEIKKKKGVEEDVELGVEDLKELIQNYKDLVKEETGRDFPQDTKEQLLMAIYAVFGSWNNDRAISYRRMNGIDNLLGTAVNVQSMVFGNTGTNSATGVAFTRNPSTGENKFYGEYLINAQGEDVVAGIRTPQPIEKLKQEMPEAYEQLLGIREKLEKHYKDMQDMEFTIEEGSLYMLQTRNGKRTAQAAVKMAVDMVDEGLLDKEDALMKIDPNYLDRLLHKRLDEKDKENHEVIAKGLPASPGAAVGKIVFSAEDAKNKTMEGEDVILVRLDTSPEDIEGMHASKGILTARGGMTSHAAVVARGVGKCCVAGCSDLNISEREKVVEVKGKSFHEGDVISLDGTTGEVFEGEVEQVDPELAGSFAKVMKWSDEIRKLNIRTNADTPNDSKKALEFGAEGIGLCRTEHMFFEADKIKAMREMILSDTKEGRKKALGKLLPIQKKDFKELFEVMNGKPVTIRLLDPPLHEFLPKEEKEILEISEELGVSPEEIRTKINNLHEFNPMLGHRGCRLGITYPEITEMQSRAIFEASAEMYKEGKKIIPEVMVPLVGNVEEFKNQKQVISNVAEEVKKESGVNFVYKVGTMIEVPRAAVTADEIAREADFFSFGTNDLTQMGCGFSRDDSGKFLNEYLDKNIYQRDPFRSLDVKGVGKLVNMALTKGRSVKKDMKMGICGEHGGDPYSIDFCHGIGLDYVSCSPFRVPIARLSAAQAKIRKKKVMEDRSKNKKPFFKNRKPGFGKKKLNKGFRGKKKFNKFDKKSN